MVEIIAVDVGGTNARFTRASIGPGGVPTLGIIRKYKVADYPSLEACWAHFARDEAAAGSAPLPRAASIAFATAIGRDVIKLTNSNWVVRPSRLGEELDLDHVRLVNDFERSEEHTSELQSH